MKKLFTLALGLCAVMGLSARTLTVTANGEPVKSGDEVVGKLHIEVNSYEFPGMGTIEMISGEVNPNLLVTTDTEASVSITLKVLTATGTDDAYKGIMFCWPEECTSYGPGATETRTGVIAADTPTNPRIDISIPQLASKDYPADGIMNTAEVTVAYTDDPSSAITFGLVLTSDPNYAGVESVIADSDLNAPREYYDLNGRRVLEPANGLYIVRQGTKVSKEYIR